jgi:hypothetical protein
MWNIILIGFLFGALTIFVCTVCLIVMAAKDEEEEGRYWSYKNKYWSQDPTKSN